MQMNTLLMFIVFSTKEAKREKKHKTQMESISLRIWAHTNSVHMWMCACVHVCESIKRIYSVLIYIYIYENVAAIYSENEIKWRIQMRIILIGVTCAPNDFLGPFKWQR